jgi:hypothetical protein|tara:strand:+ start:1458 stop:1664 length:207 start_codon:yes stop_codon:yes gene_type:complete
MFFFVFGLICGIILAQEVQGVPKLKPYLQAGWQKINGVVREVESDASTEVESEESESSTTDSSNSKSD